MSSNIHVGRHDPSGPEDSDHDSLPDLDELVGDLIKRYRLKKTLLLTDTTSPLINETAYRLELDEFTISACKSNTTQSNAGTPTEATASSPAPTTKSAQLLEASKKRPNRSELSVNGTTRIEMDRETDSRSKLKEKEPPRQRKKKKGGRSGRLGDRIAKARGHQPTKAPCAEPEN